MKRMSQRQCRNSEDLVSFTILSSSFDLIGLFHGSSMHHTKSVFSFRQGTRNKAKKRLQGLMFICFRLWFQHKITITAAFLGKFGSIRVAIEAKESTRVSVSGKHTKAYTPAYTSSRCCANFR